MSMDETRHMKPKRDVQQGTLALMVLRTLDVLGPLHGYGVARRIEQISGDMLSVNQGTLYPSCLGWNKKGQLPRNGLLRRTTAGRVFIG
jgi:PadR family transcriptional regulator, regulatory protein PadR